MTNYTKIAIPDLKRQNKTVETISQTFQVKTTLYYFRFVELRPLKELTLEFSSVHTNILIVQFYFLQFTV